MDNQVFLEIIKDSPFIVLLNSILVIILFYFMLKEYCNLNDSLIKRKQNKNELIMLLIKSVVFSIIAWLLGYLFDITSFFDDPELYSVESWVQNIKYGKYGSRPVMNLQQHLPEILTWLLFLGYSLINFSILCVISNIILNIIFSSVYIFFNIQLGFVSLGVLFFSYFSNTNFFLSYFIIFVALIIGWIFFKLKKKLLDRIRAYFASLQPHQLASRRVKIGEFYLICTPYIIYSTLFSIVVLEELFNLLIQLIAAHLFSYLVIFKLYKAGHDMGFDYDPF